EAFEDLDRRRLAGAVGAEEGVDLARRDEQVEVVDRRHGSVGLAETADLDRRPAGDRGAGGCGGQEGARGHGPGATWAGAPRAAGLGRSRVDCGWRRLNPGPDDGTPREAYAGGNDPIEACRAR